MADVWNRTVTYGGTYDGSKISLSVSAAGKNVGMLATQVQISAQRNIGQLMNLSDGKLWFVAALPQPAVVQISGLIMNSTDYEDFTAFFGDACSGQDITINITPPSCSTTGQSLSYVLRGAVLSSRADTVNAQNMYYTGNITLLGTSLETSIGTSPTTTTGA